MKLYTAIALCLIPTFLSAQPRFDDVDVDNDNFIQRQELNNERMKRFDIMDLNGDKIVQRQELLTGGSTWQPFTLENSTAFLLMYDLDNDGSAALWEVSKVMDSVDIFANLDFDKNEKIDRDEAREIFDTTNYGEDISGISLNTIITELSQGLRPQNGFKPIINPEQPIPRSYTRVIMEDGELPVQLMQVAPQRQENSRAGWVANTQQEPGNLNRYQPNSVPPGQQDPTQPVRNTISNSSFFN